MLNLAGSEMRTVELYKLLEEVADVTIWSEHEPSPVLANQVPIRRIRPRSGIFPMFGTMVFVGFYFAVGRWVRWSFARRRIIICNTFPKNLGSYTAMRQRLSCGARWPVEVVYAGHEIAEAIGERGPIFSSLIDLRRFRPGSPVRRDGEFRVGRVSRDDVSKHHEGAAALYRRLVSAGCSVRIMGGTVLGHGIADAVPGLELLPAAAEDSAAFLQGLDCFVYRTNDSYFETFGRVIFEAMATGLPVVAHRRGGYARFLNDGEDALLFETDEQAFDLVMRLRSDVELRQRIGRNARRRAEAMYSRSNLEDMRRFLLRAGAEPSGTDPASSILT
jgi:glycosyltransferase involved in cell wall biosynthesis